MTRRRINVILSALGIALWLLSPTTVDRARMGKTKIVELQIFVEERK